MYEYMYVCKYVYICMHYTHMHASKYVCYEYMYVYMCVFIYAYK